MRLKRHDIGNVNRFFDIVLHYLCNTNLENNQPRSRKVEDEVSDSRNKAQKYPKQRKSKQFWYDQQLG